MLPIFLSLKLLPGAYIQSFGKVTTYAIVLEVHVHVFISDEAVTGHYIKSLARNESNKKVHDDMGHHGDNIDTSVATLCINEIS